MGAACEDDPRYIETLASLPAPLDRYRREATETLAGFDRASPDPGGRLFNALTAQAFEDVQ